LKIILPLAHVSFLVMSALVMSDYVLRADDAPETGDKFVIWIDQVGAYLLCLADEVTFGGPAAEGNGADVPLLANLSRRHATFMRSGERYVLLAHSPTQAGGRAVHDRVDLADGHDITLGGSVQFKFRLPSVMSGSARIEFVSDHRPARAADGVVLMDDTCLIGPGPENHIRCHCWPGSVLLFRRDGRLWCKSRDELFLGGRHAPEGGQLEPGVVVTGTDLRFRLESIPQGGRS
jgi:hypothetical protein